ncbi:MAG: glycosyltransferase family 2 protein [Acidimicrobiales bacterium]|nr:glycosyltransferase family 2 protein [Acidimicrobiales bacterium]
MTDVSVALCTYQGERFLAEQLQSIARQALLPVELVVCDDGSTDGTPEVVARFAELAPFPVRFHVNAARLGVAGNFSRAISLCQGEVIALADQDDVWLPAKLERLVVALDDHPDVGAAFSDAELVDASLRPLGRTMFDVTRFTPRRRRRFVSGRGLDVLLARNVVCGATLAFRSSLRDLLLPIPTTGLHDMWLSTLLCAVTEVAVVDEPLVRYRQHGANQVGAPATTLRAKLTRRRTQGVFGDELAHYQGMLARLAAQPPAMVDPHKSEILERKVRHLEFRYDPSGHRTIPVIAELARGHYHRYSRGVESAGYDLFFR